MVSGTVASPEIRNLIMPPLKEFLVTQSARGAEKGLGLNPAPIPPWVYRKARRGQSLDLTDRVSLEREIEGSSTPRGPLLLGAVQPESSTDSTSSPYPIIGNRRFHIYHRPDCPY